MTGRFLMAVALALSAVAACKSDGPSANGFRCSTQGTCPQGYQCLEDRCWRGGVRPDATPPDDQPDAASVDAPRGGATPEAGGADAPPPPLDTPTGDTGAPPADARTDTTMTMDLARPADSAPPPDLGPLPDGPRSLSPNGAPCTRREDCQSGSCSPDGTCCNTDCTSPCEACDVAGNVGRCTRVPSGQPHGKPACTGSGECGGSCNGTSAMCAFPTSACGTAICSGAVLTRKGTCNGAGICAPGGTQDCGSVYRCSPGADACPTSCSSSADCTAAYFCAEGRCQSDVVAVSRSGPMTCAVLATGKVKCWGDNEHGGIGNGTFGQPVLSPAEVKDLADVKTVSVGFQHACALLNNQRLRCWGRNDRGQLGDGTMNNRSSPAPVLTGPGQELANVTQVSAGGGHVCALAGQLYCWGDGSKGELADQAQPIKLYATAINGIRPSLISAGNGFNVAREGSDACAWGGNTSRMVSTSVDDKIYTPACTPVGEIAELAGGGEHACARLRDGSLRCWGYGGLGALGAGMAQNGIHPPPGLSIAGTADKLVVGESFSCARFLPDRAIRCWGANVSGQIGDGMTVGGSAALARFAPSAVLDLGSDVVELGAGPTASGACAILNDGALKCWGGGYLGQLGTGDTKDSNRPVGVRW